MPLKMLDYDAASGKTAEHTDFPWYIKCDYLLVEYVRPSWWKRRRSFSTSMMMTYVFLLILTAVMCGVGLLELIMYG